MDGLVGSRVSEPLLAFEERLGEWVRNAGYAPSTAKLALRALARLSVWMRDAGVERMALTPEVLEGFGRVDAGVRVVLRFLRGVGAIPVGQPLDVSPVGVLLGAFGAWLRLERGLASESVRCYGQQSRAFLLALGDPLPAALRSLDAGWVTSFMAAHCVVLGGASAKAAVTSIRALLRFLHVAGWIPVPLVGAVPAVAGWRQASLPRGLEVGVAARILAACDRSTLVGRRDFAMLSLLASLGLRGAEVAGLGLEDVDWRAGEVMVRGKGGTVARLPLPVTAGEAVLAYVIGGRPRCACRAVFITTRPPHRAMRPDALRAVMGRACARAGLPRFGTHRFRHTLASDLLRAGGSLAEVSQVLRHQSALSTSLYAKVDERALTPLARAWPAAGGGVAP